MKIDFWDVIRIMLAILNFLRNYLTGILYID